MGQHDDDSSDLGKWIKNFDSKLSKNQQSGSDETKQNENLPNTAVDSMNNQNLTVEHKMEVFEDKEEVILTLKDSEILEKDNINENDDILINQNLYDDEKTAKKVKDRLTAHSSAYNPYDAGELDNKKEILDKYNEIIDGPSRKQFKLSNLSENRSSNNDGKTLEVDQENFEEKPSFVDLEGLIKESTDYLSEDQIVIL